MLEPACVLFRILYILQPVPAGACKPQMVQTDIPRLSQRKESGHSIYLLSFSSEGFQLPANILYGLNNPDLIYLIAHIIKNV